jgi:hypothetical protein
MITVPATCHVSPPPMYIDEITSKVSVGQVKLSADGMQNNGHKLQFAKTVTSPGTEEYHLVEYP